MSSTEFASLASVEESADEFEEGHDCEMPPQSPQSPKTVLPLKRKRWYLVSVSVSITMVGLLMIYTDPHLQISSTHVHLEARVGGAWPRSDTHSHYNPVSCEDDGIDCCHVYDKNQDYTISPRRIVKRDGGSNCPSLSTLVANYNDYHIRYFGPVNCSATDCCSIDIRRDELLRNNITVEEFIIPIEISKGNLDTCPTIQTLITKYENYYEETNPIFVIIFLCIVICFLCSPSKVK